MAVFFAMALAGMAAPACAQQAGNTAEPDGGGSIFDIIAHGLSKIGARTQEFVAPGFSSPSGQEDNSPAKFNVTREFEENYPVRPTVRLAITHADGEVRIETWDNPVVNVRAEITAGADTFEMAQEICTAINIDVA